MQQLKLGSNVEKLHALFSKNLYSSKYSWISEVCQNAVDSHRMAKVKEPVTVGIRRHQGGHVFYVQDVGLSFTDKKDFIAKICTLMESGKDSVKTGAVDEAMGKHGIGSISVCAYQPEWKYFVVTPTGEKFMCEMIDKPGAGLNYEITDIPDNFKPKGVLFEVNIRNEFGEFTMTTLIDQMLSKLAYFKDIHFNICADVIKSYPKLLTINSTFKLFDSDDFQISTLSERSDLHISLDQYSYDIDWKLLKIAPIQMNVALKFTMADGLEPNLTRETLKQDDLYPEIIKEKIDKVAKWFVERYNSSVPDEYTSIKSMLQELATTNKHVTIGETVNDITTIKRYAGLPVKVPVFKGVTQANFNTFTNRTNNGHHFLNLKYHITQNGTKVSKTYEGWGYEKMRLMADIPITPKMMGYLRSEYRGWMIYTRKDVTLLPKKGANNPPNLKNLLVLPKDKSKWREILSQCEILLKSTINDYYTPISKIKIPEGFNAKPKATIVRRQAEDAVIKYARFAQNSSCKFVPITIAAADLVSLPQLHVYATEEKRDKLETIFKLYFNGTMSKTIVAGIIGISQHKMIKSLKLDNFMEVDEFMQGKHPLFREMITSYIISSKMRDKFLKTFKVKHLVREYVSNEIAEDLNLIEVYAQKFSSSANRLVSTQYMTAMLALASELNLYDMDMFAKYEKMDKVIDNLDYIGMLESQLNTTDLPTKERVERMIKEITNQRRLSVDWGGYKIMEK